MNLIDIIKKINDCPFHIAVLTIDDLHLVRLFDVQDELGGRRQRGD